MTTTSQTTKIDVRTIAPPDRHATLFSAFEVLAAGDSLDILVDHDPKGLHQQLSARAPNGFSWEYLQQGPEIWQVSIRKAEKTHGSDYCCGGCGGEKRS